MFLKSVSNNNFCNQFFGKITVYVLAKSIGKEVQKVDFCQYRKPCFNVAAKSVMVQLKDNRTYSSDAGTGAPQYFEDQLTLFEPGKAD